MRHKIQAWIATALVLLGVAGFGATAPAYAMYYHGGSGTSGGTYYAKSGTGTTTTHKATTHTSSSNGFNSSGSTGSKIVGTTGSSSSGSSGHTTVTHYSNSSSTVSSTGTTTYNQSSGQSVTTSGNAGSCAQNATCSTSWTNNYSGSGGRFGITNGSTSNGGVTGVASSGTNTATSQTQTTTVHCKSGTSAYMTPSGSMVCETAAQAAQHNDVYTGTTSYQTQHVYNLSGGGNTTSHTTITIPGGTTSSPPPSSVTVTAPTHQVKSGSRPKSSAPTSGVVSCPSGETYNATYGTCTGSSGVVSCPSGETYNATYGTCQAVPTSTASCVPNGSLTPYTYGVGTGTSTETCTVDVNSCGETVGTASCSLVSSTPSSTTPPPSSTTPTSSTPTCPSGTAWDGSACIGTAPTAPAIGATFTIWPTKVLPDQPETDTAAYQEVLDAGIQVHSGYAISGVRMWFTDPKGDVNGTPGMPISMDVGGASASVPEPTWHYLNNVAAAQFEEDWNSYYGFWNPNIGEPGTNHTPDTFPVYATATVTGYGITKTIQVEIPQFELMSSLTYPEVGPTVPIQDISPVVAGVVSPSGFHPAQHAANTIAGAESALSEAYNWVLQQIGLESPPTQNLP